jgi:hypothetical protein
MKPTFITPLTALLLPLACRGDFIGALYENPDACEYTDEYQDGHGCPSVSVGGCCYKDGSLYGSGEIVTEDIANPSDYLTTIASSQENPDTGDLEYCRVFLTTVSMNDCGVGGELQIVGGVTFDPRRVMANEQTEDQVIEDRAPGASEAGSSETEVEKLRREQTAKFGAWKPPTGEAVKAELALFGPDFIYFISDAKLAELEAQGLGKPDDKQERIEWFKKHYTTIRKNGPRLQKRV